MNRQMLLVLGLAVATWPGMAWADGVSYSGRLSRSGTNADGRLFVTGPEWNSALADVTLGWVVDNTTTPGMWHYVYSLTVPSAECRSDIQCVLIETTDGSGDNAFSAANLFSAASAPDDWLVTTQIGPFRAGDEPDLPRDLYGVEFCTVSRDPTTLVVSFDSDRAPMWGDLYARSLVAGDDTNVLYNAGMLVPNPSDTPRDGSVEDHVLVPDTVGGQFVIPAPAAVLLGAVGLGITGWLRRRQWL